MKDSNMIKRRKTQDYINRLTNPELIANFRGISLDEAKDETIKELRKLNSELLTEVEELEIANERLLRKVKSRTIEERLDALERTVANNNSVVDRFRPLK